MEHELCRGCPSRLNCEIACPELQAHLKKIEVPMREKLVGDIRFGRWPDFLRPRKRFNGTEAEIAKMLLTGKDFSEICEALKITKNHLYNIIFRMKQKI